MSRNAREGTPVDQFVMYDGGFFQYQTAHRIDAFDTASPLRPLDESVPSSAAYSHRGRWFTEERAEELLDTEFRYKSVSH